MPLRYWQVDNRTSTAVLPPLRATQKGNLASRHCCSPQALMPGVPTMYCHLHRGDWSFHLTNEKKKNNNHNNNRIHRCNSRFLTISSLCCELSPTHMLKWPQRNHVQITCNTLSAYHVQHVVLRATWYGGIAQLLK